MERFLIRGPGVRLLAAAAVVALLAVVLPGTGQAEARRFMSGWIPYWSTDASLASFSANSDLFADVSPFWHSLKSDTSVSDDENSADRSRVITAVRKAGVRLVPAVTDGTGTGQLAAALADPGRRSTVVQTLVNLTTSRGYDGIDLDLEGFAYADGKASWPTTRPNWVAFVAELAAQMHARGKVLYATIPPTYDSNQTATSGYWVYDYAGIAPHVDRVRIMAYDYSVGAPGPIAPYDWVKKILTYAVTQVPSWKVVLGVPAYGRDWVSNVAGSCPAGTDLAKKSLTAPAAWTLASNKGATVQWDSKIREQTFSYVDTFADASTSCQVTHVVWFSDARAVVERARLLDTYKLGAVAEWTIGGEDPQQWELLRIMAANPWDPRVAPQEVLEAYVQHAYQDVLGRDADPAGTQTWMNAIRTGAVSRYGFMTGLIYSYEDSARTVTSMYTEILGRGPDPGGLASWSNALSSRAASVKDSRAAFWSSAERVSRSPSIEQWVGDLYTVELGRGADPAGLAHWSSVARTQGVSTAARGIIGSQEWAQRQVAGLYQLMLKRDADPGGLSSWSAVLISSDVPVVQANFGASDEYFMRGAR